jgi:hypothetical protein
MEAIVPAGVVVIAGLTLQIAGLLFLCVLLARSEAEGRRATRELETMLDSPLDQTTPPIEPSAS